VIPYESRQLLKKDPLGTVSRLGYMQPGGAVDCVERDTQTATRGLRWAARRLAAREARALGALAGLAGVPVLLHWDGRRLRRSWLEGAPLNRVRPRDPAYYREALHLVRRLHASGLLHNGLAEPPNWLVMPEGRPALVDFRLAVRPPFRGRIFRALAYEDLRHLLTHKRTYCPERLTARQHSVLARPSPIAALWAYTGKPVYRLLTRPLPGPSDREAAGGPASP